MLIVCLIIVALAWAVYSAVIEIARQIEACGRVRMWDWVTYTFCLGWLLDVRAALAFIIERIDAFTLWVRVHWQSIGEPVAGIGASGVWIHGTSGDVDDFRDWLERSGADQ